MDLAFTPEHMVGVDSMDPLIFGSIRTKEQLQKLTGLLVSGLISLYLMYSLRATFLVRFGVFGLVMPAGVVLFGFLAFKEICDLFSLLTIWSMIDSSELSMGTPFSLESEQVEESKTKKKVRFVGLPPVPPKRRRSTSLPPILSPAAPVAESKDSLLSVLFSTLISPLFSKSKTETQIDADDLLTSAWGSE